MTNFKRVLLDKGLILPQADQGLLSPQANQGLPSSQADQGLPSPQASQGHPPFKNFTTLDIFFLCLFIKLSDSFLLKTYITYISCQHIQAYFKSFPFH